MIIFSLVCDITTLHVDAMVNAANTQLLAGGGVCGAIYRAAGPKLHNATRIYGYCPVGSARATGGFDSRAKVIIHAVGPIWVAGSEQVEVDLRNAYMNALLLADALGCESVAFPAISTGIYGYPLEAATKIAVSVMKQYAPHAQNIRAVYLSCFDDATLRVYQQEMGAEYLDIPSETSV